MKRKPFSEEIRDAVRRSGRNNSNLSNAMNTQRSVLYRFMKYEAGMSTKVLDRLAEVLDLHVVVGSNRARAGK
jgi:ribosome-binding protein aMBF1 (putative translation factor)